MVVEKTAEVTTEELEVLAVEEKIAAIDAGHGGFGVTAGKRTPDGEYEWDFNNKVVLALIAKLQYNGVKVIRTDDPTGKTDVSLGARVKKANDAKADIFVSVHHNANTGVWGEWTGTETFSYSGSSNPKSEALAKAVQPHLVKAMGLRDRGTKKQNFYVLRETTMPAILTEGGYMDSKIDIKKMRDNKVLKAAGEAIADGILKYFGITPKVEIPKATPVKEVPKTQEIFRVRKTWADEESQVGAYSSLESAKEVAEKHKYYRVFNSKGVIVWQPEYEKEVVAPVKKPVVKPAPKPAPKPVPKPVKAKYKIPSVTVKIGSKGVQVELLQNALNNAGFRLRGNVDGFFGPDTLQALRRFQAVYSNPVDGIAGPKTRAALNKVLNG